MKRIAIGLAGVLAVLLVPAGAGAELCQKCQGMMYTADIGTCTACGGTTSSGAFKLCKACSEKQGKCQHCQADLKAKAPVAVGGGDCGTPAPAVGPLPPALDLTKSSTQTIGRWKFLHLMRGAGSKSERSIGQLYYDGKEVPAGSGINDYYQTPWGALYWVGKNAYGPSGWMPVRIDPKPQGKALEPPSAGVADLCLGEADSGKTVEALPGQKIVIRLPGNPTTGYSWFAGKTEGEAVKLVGEIAYRQDAAPEGMVGVGGQFAATFEAAKAGQAKISLEYTRPWEKDTPPIKTFAVTVNVKAGALALGEADNGKRVEARVGQKITVRLAANASTGFSWSVKSPAGEGAVKSCGAVSYAAGDPRSARPGAGGTAEAVFEAVKAGEVKIEMEYRRAWEKDKAPGKTWSVTVVVKPAGA